MLVKIGASPLEWVQLPPGEGSSADGGNFNLAGYLEGKKHARASNTCSSLLPTLSNMSI